MADPPAGVRRFEGDTLQPNMAACGITTALIALAVVGLRLYTRFFLTVARFQVDDGNSQFETKCRMTLVRQLMFVLLDSLRLLRRSMLHHADTYLVQK